MLRSGQYQRDARRAWGLLRPLPNFADSDSEELNVRIPSHLSGDIASNALVQQFEEMGFNRNSIVAALLHTANDFGAALNALLRG